MGETRHGSSIPSTILRDIHERRTWTSKGCAAEARDVTPSTGDCVVPIACTHDPESDTYHPRFTVERKSGDDFLTTLTWEQDRLCSELRRVTKWSQPLAVVVETSWETLFRNRGCMMWRGIHPSQMAGTLSTWIQHYNVVSRFVELRRQTELCTFLLLIRHNLRRRRKKI